MSLQASFSIKKVLQITKRAQGSPAAQCRAGVESPRASVLLPQQAPSQSCLNISAWRFGLISPTPTGVTNHLSTCRRGKRGSGTVQGLQGLTDIRGRNCGKGCHGAPLLLSPSPGLPSRVPWTTRLSSHWQTHKSGPQQTGSFSQSPGFAM